MPRYVANAPAAPKQPIKKLPPTIELSPDTPVEVVKAYIARQTGFSDHNRIGLFDPSTKKTLKDRKAAISSYANVASSGELLVKDLGAFPSPYPARLAYLFILPASPHARRQAR